MYYIGKENFAVFSNYIKILSFLLHFFYIIPIYLLGDDIDMLTKKKKWVLGIIIAITLIALTIIFINQHFKKIHNSSIPTSTPLYSSYYNVVSNYSRNDIILFDGTISRSSGIQQVDSQINTPLKITNEELQKLINLANSIKPKEIKEELNYIGPGEGSTQIYNSILNEWVKLSVSGTYKGKHEDETAQEILTYVNSLFSKYLDNN